MPCTANWLLKMFKTQPRSLGKRCLPNIACCSSLAIVNGRDFFTCTERRDTLHPADKLASGVMSALPPKADMCSARGNVCYGPEADMCSARLVSAKGQRRKSFQGL